MTTRTHLLLILAVGTVLRLTPVLLTANIGIGLDDMFQYDDLAQNVLAGKGYLWYGGIPTAYRPPLYPALLALLYFFTGPSHLAARVLQALLGAILPIITYELGARVFGEKRISLVAAWSVALFPLFWLYPLGLATENLYIPLLSLFVLALLWAGDDNYSPAGSGQRLRYLFAGLLFGLTTLTRSVIALFLPLALVWLWKQLRGDLRERLMRVTVFILTFLALTVPWSIRNSLLFGEPVFIESSLGFNLYLGYHPDSDGTFHTPIALEILDEVQAEERMDFQVEKDLHRLGMAKTAEFIRRDPLRVVYLIANKISYMFRFDTRGAMYFYSNNFLGTLPTWLLLLVAALIILPTAFLLLGSAVGVVAGGWTPRTVLLNLLFVYYVGIHSLILAEPRFLLPLIPLIAIYAAKGFYSWRAIFASPRLKLMVLALWLLLFFNWGYEFGVEAERWRLILSPDGNLAGFSY